MMAGRKLRRLKAGATRTCWRFANITRDRCPRDSAGVPAAGCPVDTAGCAIHLVPGVRGTSGGRDGEEKKMAPGGCLRDHPRAQGRGRARVSRQAKNRELVASTLMASERHRPVSSLND
jgi:hypothetical protein